MNDQLTSVLNATRSSEAAAETRAFVEGHCRTATPTEVFKAHLLFIYEEQDEDGCEMVKVLLDRELLIRAYVGARDALGRPVDIYSPSSGTFLRLSYSAPKRLTQAQVQALTVLTTGPLHRERAKDHGIIEATLQALVRYGMAKAVYSEYQITQAGTAELRHW